MDRNIMNITQDFRYNRRDPDGNVLCIGFCKLDVVLLCESYPKENRDHRCVSHQWLRGGNAAKIANVFVEYGRKCDFLGPMSRDLIGQFLKKDFKEHNISIQNYLYCEKESPVSYIWVNAENLSNTTVGSYKYLPEVTYEDFCKVDLKEYTWIHYESGPKFKEMKRNLKVINRWNENEDNNYVTVSISIVDPSPAQAELIDLADVIFISKEFAKTRAPDSWMAVCKFRRHLKLGAVLICFWDGAASAREYPGRVCHFKTYNTAGYVNTLDADETFTAVTILNMMKGNSVETAIKMGWKAAGRRCCMHNVKGLAELCPIKFILDVKIIEEEVSIAVEEILNAVEDILDAEQVLETIEEVVETVEDVLIAVEEDLNADK